MSKRESRLKQQLAPFGQVWTSETTVAPIYFRDALIDQLVRSVDDDGRSLLLTGLSGVGKTAILSQVVSRLTHGERGRWVVVQSTAVNLLAGKKYIGEWQQVVKDLLAIADAKKRVAVWVTDIAHLCGIGTTSTSDDNMASAMAPAIERGELILLGECTPQSYSRNLESQQWFTKLLQNVPVESLNDSESKEVVSRVFQSEVANVALRRGIEVTTEPAAVDAVNNFGATYFPGLARPAGALELAKQVARSLDQQFRSRRSSATVSQAKFTCDYSDVVSSLASTTGIPRQLLDDTIRLPATKVREFLHSRIVGQDAAVDQVVDQVTLIKAGLNDPSKPLGVMLFAGPTGVGKTELAKALAEFVFGSADRLLRVDMSEFKDFHAFEKWIGSSGGRMPNDGLPARVRRQPFSVILLDEVEKAHSNMFDLLLQVFDDGRLTDASGEVTNFNQTIIAMTSNLGSRVDDGQGFGFGPDVTPSMEETIQGAIQAAFRPELVNRIDRVVPFQPLSRSAMRTIAKRELGRVLMRSGITRRRLRVDVDRGVIDLLAKKGYQPAFGARPMKRAVEQLALLPLARKLAEMGSDRRPALLRLLPGENNVRLQVVHDRQSKRNERMTRPTVVDPVSGKTKKIHPRDIRENVQELVDRLDHLLDEFDRRSVVDRRSDLVAASGEVDFWDDAEQSRFDLSELYRLERLIASRDELTVKTTALRGDCDGLDDRSPPQLWSDVASQADDLKRTAELLQYSIRCEDSVDRCDAFLIIEASYGSALPHLKQLVEMYTAWTRRMGFDLTLVHEQTNREGSETGQVVLLIEGNAVYGVLRCEHGLHEFHQGKQDNEFVLVTVMPVDESDDPKSDTITVESKVSSGRGSIIGDFKSVATAIQNGNDTLVKIENALPVKESDSLVRDLLLSEVRRQRLIAASDKTELEIARRYRMASGASARDPRTGVTVDKLNDLWKGKLNPFFIAWLDQ